MKNRLFAILLACIFISIMTTETTLAEEFSVRNGIHFGMSKDAVIDAEAGLELSWKGEEFEKNPNGHNYLYGHPSSLAGISNTDEYVDDVNIFYYFDNDDTLIKIAYSFAYDNETNSIFGISNEAKKRYKELYAVLEKKYTQINAIQNGKIEFYPYAGETYYNFANIIRDYGSFFKVHDWNRFLIESNDGGVDIHFWYMSHFSSNITTIYIEYLYCSPSIYQNILEDYGRVAKEQETDL